MAATTAGRALTEAHRLAQVRLAAEITLQIRRIWPALNPAQLTATWPAVEEAITALVMSGRVRSAQAAAAYLEAFIAAEAGRRVTPALVSGIERERVTASLRVTGPVAIKEATARGVPLTQAYRTALARVAGAASRHVVDAGRETQIETGRRAGYDRWARVSDGDPCHFCAMLVARGPAYRTSDTARFVAHDSCGCTVELVVAGDGWTDQARRFEQLWDQAQREGDTRDAALNFRRFYERASA